MSDRGSLFDGFSRGVLSHLVCHCLLIETDQGLVLIDTGFGLRDIQSPYSRLSPFFVKFNNIQFDRKYTAIEQIQQLGFSASDVRHIVLTHLDFDHAGGLEDFPEATVHVMQTEIDTAHDRQGLVTSGRYRPQQWDEVKRALLNLGMIRQIHPHPSPLPKGEGTRLLAPFSLERRVGEGFAPLREEGNSYLHSATPLNAGNTMRQAANTGLALRQFAIWMDCHRRSC